MLMMMKILVTKTYVFLGQTPKSFFQFQVFFMTCNFCFIVSQMICYRFFLSLLFRSLLHKKKGFFLLSLQCTTMRTEWELISNETWAEKLKYYLNCNLHTEVDAWSFVVFIWLWFTHKTIILMDNNRFKVCWWLFQLQSIIINFCDGIFLRELSWKTNKSRLKRFLSLYFYNNLMLRVSMF